MSCVSFVSCIELCELCAILGKQHRVTIVTLRHWAEWKSKTLWLVNYAENLRTMMMMMIMFFSRPTAQTTWYQTLPRRQAQCILVSKPPSSPWDTIAGDTDGDGFCLWSTVSWGGVISQSLKLGARVDKPYPHNPKAPTGQLMKCLALQRQEWGSWECL